MFKKSISIMLAIVMLVSSVIGASLVNASAETNGDSRSKLEELLIEHMWDFEFLPEHWYEIYTKESYDAYLAAEQKAIQLLYHDENATDEDYDAMYEEFKTAHDNLVRVEVLDTTKSDSRSKLQELLTEYNSNFSFDYPSYYYYIYTKASFNAFLDAKQKAENLLADENTTDEEFENMITELQTARNSLVEIVRSESYERLMMLSASYSWDFDYTPEYWYSFYTRESYDAYLAAKQKAEKLLAEEYPSDEELEAMIEEFTAAHDNLVRVYKSESYIDLAYMYSVYSYDFEQPPEYWYNFYTKKSYDAYLAAKEKAEKLLADDNATDEELEAMIKEFRDARDNLVNVEDAGWADVTKEDLKNLLDDTYEAIQPGDLYSDESLNTFSDAQDFAREILEKENPTQEELNNAYYNLVSAIENLEKVGWVASPFLLGDCDNDGEITVKDATKIQMTLAKFDDISYYVMADVDRNFSIDIQDATKIQLYCAGFTGEENCAYTGEYYFYYYYNELYTI